MFEMWYQVHYWNKLYGTWEALTLDGELRRFWNPYEAQKKSDEICTLGSAKDAFVCKVTRAPYSCVVTRATMIMTTYEALIKNAI